MSNERIARTILGTLRSADIPLYAIIDGARHMRPLEWLGSTPMVASSLYSGIRQTTLGHLAPHILAFEPAHESAWLELIARYWAHSCLYFVSSAANPEQTRYQLKRSLQIKMPDGRIALFRYYDPRAWLYFCKIATYEQYDAFFGRVLRAVHVEIDAGEQLLTSEVPPYGWVDRLTGLPRTPQFYAHPLEAAC